MKILLIVAAGKSSRFGGFPKAFCKVGNKTNVENTCHFAKRYFDKIYIGVNKKTYDTYAGKITGCEMFYISTGQGDAHSMLKCLNYINDKESELNKIVVCWGDAVFINDAPFQQILGGGQGIDVAVACAMDEQPYAWFEVNQENEIIKSHFAKDEGFVNMGLHDQSLFLFDFNFVLKYLNEYRRYLGIPYDNDESTSDVNEMKLLYSFEFLDKFGYKRAKCVEITSGNVLSFNTQEELQKIIEKRV